MNIIYIKFINIYKSNLNHLTASTLHFVIFRCNHKENIKTIDYKRLYEIILFVLEIEK